MFDVDHTVTLPPPAEKVEFMTAPEIAHLLYKTVFRFADERGLQDSMEELFKSAGVPYQREVILSARDRIDFMSDSIGIEVKVDSPSATVERQLARYAEDDRITHLILVTTRAKHKSVTGTLNGKPVIIVHLLASIF